VSVAKLLVGLETASLLPGSSERPGTPVSPIEDLGTVTVRASDLAATTGSQMAVANQGFAWTQQLVDLCSDLTALVKQPRD
jgi:hypothetical protein